ncbi:MAG: hypothetical protein QOH41_722 [Blastocatellia bacterium]|jgi:hypothetical protein|nr:hypothetical protein [Blastocatellia bacterium]
MKKLLLTAAGVFGAIPGLTVMQSGMGTPPGYKVLFGGVIEAFGTLGLLILWTNRKRIKRFASRRVTRLSLILASAAFGFLVVYIVVFPNCVVSHPRGTAYYPIWVTGKAADMVNRAGSRNAAIERYGIDAVREAIDQVSGWLVPVTTVILLFLYQGIFTTLSLCFDLVGFHEGKQLQASSSKRGLTATPKAK